MDDVDLPVDKDQPYDVTMASQNNYTFEFRFGDDHTYTPALEPGPSHVLRSHEVFNIVPQSESNQRRKYSRMIQFLTFGTGQILSLGLRTSTLTVKSLISMMTVKSMQHVLRIQGSHKLRMHANCT